LRWHSILLVACLLLAGCNKYQHKKPDPTMGVVTGIVICADTGKPARFATVALTAAPKEGEKSDEGDPLPSAEMTVTDLEGRFRMEAVEPGRYYAFATLDGYLDPTFALDPDKLKSMATDRERHLYSIQQWKDNLVEVRVSVRRTAEVSISIQRSAEIAGTVTFDDGSPAIGMRFELFRKTAKQDWVMVGLPLMDTWTIHSASDSHGRYLLTNLTAGVYKVCTLMPTGEEQAAPRVCLGDVFRLKDAESVKVAAGETADGTDVEIPLSGMHTVSGTVSATIDGHPVAHGTVRLLYADDREVARATDVDDNGGFELSSVPEGKYILAVTGTHDEEQKDPATSKDGEAATAQNVPGQAAGRVYADKEMPLLVMNDVENLSVSLPVAGSATTPAAVAPPAAPPAPQ